jgi:4-oxalocrotonate tautomerase family enzyme
MPQIYCNIPAGVPNEKKRAMLAEIIEVTHRATGSDPSIVNVIVYEIEPGNYVVNGVLPPEQSSRSAE